MDHKVLSIELAARIWNAHREIAAGKKLLEEMKSALERGADPNPLDAFGRRQKLQLGVPSGENSHQLYAVEPKLATHIIEAHIANKERELVEASIAARVELGMSLIADTKPTSA